MSTCATPARATMRPCSQAPRHAFTSRQQINQITPRRSRVTPTRAAAEEGELPTNSAFNAQFMGVLQQSIARQGADALTKGVEKTEESRISAVEEVLGTALNQSVLTLRMLNQWRNQIDAQIAAQEKQVDRMEFALNKARSDAALLKALKQMVYSNTD